jgi:hypothetical protein
MTVGMTILIQVAVNIMSVGITTQGIIVKEFTGYHNLAYHYAQCRFT